MKTKNIIIIILIIIIIAILAVAGYFVCKYYFIKTSNSVQNSKSSIVNYNFLNGQAYYVGDLIDISLGTKNDTGDHNIGDNVSFEISEINSDESIIKEEIPNYGFYSWKIPSNFSAGSYKISIVEDYNGQILRQDGGNFTVIKSLAGNLKTYENNEYGFELKYTSDWNIMQTWRPKIDGIGGVVIGKRVEGSYIGINIDVIFDNNKLKEFSGFQKKYLVEKNGIFYFLSPNDISDNDFNLITSTFKFTK